MSRRCHSYLARCYRGYRCQGYRYGGVLNWVACLLCCAIAPERAHAETQLPLAEFLSIDREIDAQLSTRLSANWQHVPLRAALERLHQTAGVVILLDRRVDPQCEIDLQATNNTLLEVVVQASEQHKLTGKPIGNFIYVATEEQVDRLWLEMAASRIRLSNAASAVPELKKKSARRWSRLSTPAQVVVEIARDAQLEVANIERVPHDLLPEFELPRLTLADQLTALLFGFDLAWQVNGRGVLEIVDLAPTSVIDRHYELATSHQSQMLESLAKVPEGAAQRRGNAIVMRGTMQQHANFARDAGLIAGAKEIRPPRDAPGAERRFTLRLQNQPAGSVIRQIAAQLGATIDNSKLDATTLDQRITLAVDKATLDELLAAIAEQAQISIERDGERWTITPN